MKNIKLAYIASFACASAALLALLYRQINSSLFDQDLLWFVPTILREVPSGSPLGILWYVFRLTSKNWVDLPSLKTYALSVIFIFGPMAKNFIFVAIFFHFLNAWLVSWFAKILGFNHRAAMLAGIGYFSFFAHFHAYMWPMAFQHLIAVFFILLGINLYFESEKQIAGNGRLGLFYVLALLAGLSAFFCRYTVLIFPAMVMGHLLFCSRTDEERIKRYTRWTPLFIISGIYPLIVISVGDIRFSAVFGRLMPFIEKAGFPILFLIWVGALFFLRFAIGLYHGKVVKKLFIPGLASILLAAWLVLIIIGGPKRLLIPYNIAVPFAGMLGAFISPLQNALLIDSSRPFYFIPLQLNAFNFTLAFIIVAVFISRFAAKQKNLIVLFVFYMITAAYLYLWNPIASRYLIYLSGIFSIVFFAVFDYLYEELCRLLKLRRTTAGVFLVIIFAGLCLSNMLAVKVALIRGGLANTFYTYDYARAAAAIKEDLSRAGRLENTGTINIGNTVPITFTARENCRVEDTQNENIRLVLKQVFNDRYLRVNTDKKAAAYYLSADGYRVISGTAKSSSPYLLDYVLAGLELKDVCWITNGTDMRTWLNSMAGFYSIGCDERELKRNKYILAIINRELDEYIRAIFYKAYSAYESGRPEEAKTLFLEIRFLDSDLNRVRALLPDTSSFAGSLDAGSLYSAPENYYNRFRFEKFLYRLIFKV